MVKKKNFKNNPVLQFISTEPIEYEDHTYDIYHHENTDSIQHVDIDSKGQHIEPIEHTVYIEHTHNAHNTALQKNKPIKTTSRETKNKRLTVLLTPSVFENTAKISGLKRTSVNNTINKALEEYIEKHEEMLKKYNMLFGDE